MLSEMMNKLSINGLEEKEGNVYLALLKFKKATVLQLARATSLQRATLYRHLAELAGKGLVSEIYEEKKHYFVAETPEALLKFLESQEENIRQLLPQLKALEDEAIERPKIKFYLGRDGIRTLYEEILQERTEIIGFSWPDKLFQAIESFPRLVERRVKLKIPIRLILPDTKVARQRKKAGEKESRQIKLVPDFQPFEIVFFMAGKKVVIFSLKSWYVGVLIENKEIALGFKALFEALWKRL